MLLIFGIFLLVRELLFKLFVDFIYSKIYILPTIKTETFIYKYVYTLCRQKMTTKKIQIKHKRLPKTRDVDEYILEWEYKQNKYVGFVEVSGLKKETENKPIMTYINETKRKFKEMISEGKIRPEDRFRFGYYVKGSFIINQNNKGKVEINGIASKYAGDRLHTEIPKIFRYLFDEGDKLKIIKDTFNE